MHAADAVHGDLGIHQNGDPVLFLSNSGSTPELLALEPILRGREAKIVGMMGSLAMTPDKASRAAFAAPAGTVGLIARERCFANNLVMRHVGDRMIISPPLVITPEEIDTLIARATKALDETYAIASDRGLLVPA